MISVERKGLGFQIKVSDPGLGRYRVFARDVREVQEAVGHYYGSSHIPGTDNCPMCRATKKEIKTGEHPADLGRPHRNPFDDLPGVNDTDWEW